MPFGLPITIKDAVEHIHKKEYLLPAIQREFVWSAEQIEKLLKIKWWEWDDEKINQNTCLLCNTDINQFINKYYQD